MGKRKPTYDVGYKGKSTTGEIFEVIKYEDRKKITIRFECGMEKNTTSTLMKQGKVKYVKGVKKYEVGDILYNRDHVRAEIVSIDRRKGRAELKFDNGNVKDYSINSLSSKDFTDSVKIKSGDVFTTNNFGDVKVVEYIDAHNVKVKFEDGVETSCQASSLRLGNVGHPMSGLHLGYKFTNNEGFSAKVIEYISPLKVFIEWEDGGITEAMAANIKIGAVYYPNQRSI